MRSALNIPFDELTVMFNGKEVFMLNPRLMDRQQCEENLEAIKEAHVLKLTIYEMIKETEDPEMLRSLAQDLTEIEFELQELWKFSKDAKFHRFWEYPKCQCPRLDNIDAYPVLQYISANCPLHGS